MPNTVVIPHSDLKLDLTRPFFFKDGEKWLVKSPGEIKLESAVPRSVEEITSDDRQKHHVLTFNCVIRRPKTFLDAKGKLIEDVGKWSDTETRLLAQTVGLDIEMRGGQVVKVSSILFKIASRLI